MLDEKISNDSVLIVDEMILQKSSVYHGGQMIGQDKNGNYYSGILTYLAGFISKKLLKKTICKECKLCEDILTSNFVEEGVDYINQLNCEGLRIPLEHLSTHVIKVFAVLIIIIIII